MLRLLRRSVSLPATYTAASSVRHASTSSIALRSYQEACVEACLDAFHTGIGRIGVSLPTGSGKTVVFLALLSRLRESQGNFGPKCALIIVPSIELAKQAKFLASVMHPDWRIEIEQGALTPASGTADLTIATYQTLMRGGRLYKYDPAKMLAVVVDEAHHAAAPSHRFILSHFDKTILPPSGYLDSHLLSTSSHHQVPIFGFSAIFSRPDGLALGSVFEKIVFHKTLLDMIEDSWLCDIRVTTVHADIPLARIKVNSKDFCTTDLASVINTPSMNSLVVQAWIERAQNRKSTLVFCATQAHVYNLKSMFRRAGIDARSVLSSTPAKQRDELVNSFRQGKFPVLVNCAVLAEGVDVPNADCIVIARPTRSHNRYSQMVGRGLRLSPETGKTDCLVIDVANVHDSLGGVVTAPTLLGLNPAAFDDDASARRVVRRRPFRNLKEPDSSRFELRPSSEVAFTDYEKPFAKGCEPLETQKPLIDITSFEWVECADGVVALDCLGAGHIRIERGQRSGNATVYRAYYTSRQPESTRIRILDTECISDAVSGCDQFVMLKLQSQIDLAELNRDADWRAAPSTEQLKAWVNQEYNRMTLKRQDERVGLVELSYYGLTPEQINKSSAGEAANILTRMEHDELTQLTKTLFTEKRRSRSENNNFRPPPAYLLTGKQSSHLPWWRGWLDRLMLQGSLH